MVLGVSGAVEVGNIKIALSNGKGLSVEHWADRCLEKLIYVAEDSNSIIKEQAVAYKESIRNALIHYMNNAIKSDRTTLYNVLLQAGETEAAEIIRRQ